MWYDGWSIGVSILRHAYSEKIGVVVGTPLAWFAYHQSL
jgi:hypothetical protein